MNILVTAILLVLLVSVSAFFSSSETAYLSLSKVTLKQLTKEKVPGIKRVLTLKNDMDRVLTTILIGNNFVNNLASSCATALAISIFGQNGVGVTTVFMTVVIILFGEILPKTIGKRNPEKIACSVSFIVLTLSWILFPFVFIFRGLQKLVSKKDEDKK